MRKIFFKGSTPGHNQHDPKAPELPTWEHDKSFHLVATLTWVPMSLIPTGNCR